MNSFNHFSVLHYYACYDHFTKNLLFLTHPSQTCKNHKKTEPKKNSKFANSRAPLAIHPFRCRIRFWTIWSRATNQKQTASPIGRVKLTIRQSINPLARSICATSWPLSRRIHLLKKSKWSIWTRLLPVPREAVESDEL